MNYATIKQTDVANGPGVRVSLFVSGCTHACSGCFNWEAWDFNYGEPYTEETKEYILKLCEPAYIRGLSLLGGEPMEPANRVEVAKLLKAFKARFPQKDVWCYSGYTYEEITKWEAEGDKVVSEMLELIDVLVDGEFVLAKKNLRLAFRGSENQRLIDMKKTRREGQVVCLDL